MMNPDEEGWSEWIHPVASRTSPGLGYLMQCCDCGLIHEMEFAIVPNEGEPTEFNEGESEAGVIVFRARRHEEEDNG